MNNRFRRFVNLWITLSAVWLIANGSLAPEVVATGVAISAALGYLLSGLGKVWADIRWSPRVIYTYFIYLGVFLYELLLANINVLLLVFSLRIDISPEIVEVKRPGWSA